MTEREEIEAAIATLQAQRALLGDAVVDAALGPMRQRLDQLELLLTDATPEQVLKHVSVLFLDVVGSTDLSQHLDPEDVHAVMDGVLERCTTIVVAHGGRVLQYAGDNLLAAFGAEQAREDDAERAVRCGLALLEEGRALREQVQRDHGRGGCDVRVGIHSGPVLLGGGVDEEGTIRGLTVNIAARMEQTAPSGALRISHDTWQLVRGVFDMLAQPPLKVKGRDDALATFLVQRAKPRAFRVPARGIEGVLPPMVGRDAELTQLSALLDLVIAQRKLRAATLIGEPGLGKSRLLHELQGALEAHPQRLWLLLGRAHPSSRLQPYGVLRDLLAWRLQIADSDSSEQAKAKLVDGLTPWLGDCGQAKAHLIGQLIGLDFTASPHLLGLEPRLLRSLAFAALHDYLRGLAAEGAVMAMLLEDLQWADDGSLDFVAELLQSGAALPLLLVATARPELLERRPDWGEGNAAHLTLPLSSLDTAQREQLAYSLLQRAADGAEPLRALLIERADGNPFYMEELVRMFIDDGVIAVVGEDWRVAPDKLRQARVPTTLVGVLQARLDALPAADRLALQQASIVGHVFWDDALAALNPNAPTAMPALHSRSLIQRRDSSAFEGTLEEAFHHHLLQQVTYDTVLKPARRAGHAAAAQWLAERVGDRPAEYLAITGEHYERAGDPIRALDYFNRAALDAQTRFANQAALEYTERALHNPAATDPRLRERLYFFKQNLADLAGDRTMQEAALAQRGVIAEALDDDALRADVMSSQALLASRRSDETLALQWATRAAELAERSGNAEAAALSFGQMAFSRCSKGEMAVAIGHAHTAVERARQALLAEDTLKTRSLEVQTLTLRAIVEEHSGELEQSRATLTEALALARERGLRRPQISVRESLGSLETQFGRYAQALSCFEQSTAQAADIGWVIYLAMGRYNMARCHQQLGQTELAHERLAAAEADARRCESRDAQGRCQLLRGQLLAAAGEYDAAQTAFECAQALFGSLGAEGFVCQVRANLALLHLAAGRLPQAQALAEQIAAQIAGGLSLAATEEPQYPHLACHRVWAASGDPRAGAAIATAHAELQALVAGVGQEELRTSILSNIPLHREIVAAWEAARHIALVRMSTSAKD